MIRRSPKDGAQGEIERLLEDPITLQAHIQRVLQAESHRQPACGRGQVDEALSVVLFLLGPCDPAPGKRAEPCLILNKRSSRVRQPGDICCPGGGVAPRFDRLAAHLLRLPLSPLRRWDYYPAWRQTAPRQTARLRMLLATALREGFEEMRLNPLAVNFQGVLPAESLVMFRRTIVPMVTWVGGQRRFFPNWEVEKVVRIPLRDLLSPDGYIGLRLIMVSRNVASGGPAGRLFPAFRHRSGEGTEILWGATYRITMNFLERVFGFAPPDPDGGAIVEKRLTADYLTGKA